MPEQAEKQKGVSIYLSLVIMAVLLAITLGLNSILFGQVKIIRNIGYSVAAFYAAETGIEEALFTVGCESSCIISGYLDLNNNSMQDADDSTYRAEGLAPNTDGCPDTATFCLKSIGAYKQIKRAIQVAR